MNAPRFRDYADYLDYLREQAESRADYEADHGITVDEAKDNARELDADARRDEDED